MEISFYPIKGCAVAINLPSNAASVLYDALKGFFPEEEEGTKKYSDAQVTTAFPVPRQHRAKTLTFSSPIGSVLFVEE